MSMEAMLDEERREILALLEQSNTKNSYRSNSPMGMRSQSPYASPRSPVRSMLDIGDDTASISSVSGISGMGAKKSPPRQVPVRSMLNLDSSAPAPVAPAVRSMLDIDSPPVTASRQLQSGPTSPVDSNSRPAAASNIAHPRSFSDTGSKPIGFGPRSSGTRLDPTAEFQFGDIITTQTGQSKEAFPKRNTQGGKRTTSAMSDVMRGTDVGSIALPGDIRGRHHSIAVSSLSSSRPSNKSKSPHNRLGMRSNSPSANLLSASLNKPANPNMMLLDDGTQLDMKNAYRKLSDANLVNSGGVLSQLPTRKRSSVQEDGSPGRLQKDYFSPDGEELGDSSDDEHNTSSEDEGERGRKMDPKWTDDALGDQAGNKAPAPGTGRKTHSLLAAAEEERKHSLYRLTTGSG
jgi:hypothetical protein